MIALAMDTAESKELTEELKALSEETFLLHSYSPGSRFGDCACGNCSGSLSFFLDLKVNEEKETRPVDDLISLERKLSRVSDAEEARAQKERLAVLVNWMNKDKEQKDWLKCPMCHKALLMDF